MFPTCIRIQDESASRAWKVENGGRGDNILLFISLKALSRDLPHTKGTTFLVRSVMGFNNFCSSSQKRGKIIH